MSLEKIFLFLILLFEVNYNDEWVSGLFELFSGFIDDNWKLVGYMVLWDFWMY